MRFIAAIVSFVIAFGAIGYGIAQRTIFAEPDNLTASTVLDSKAPITIIDSKTLKAVPGRQKIDISGAKTVFAAYGRTEDVMAWVGKAGYNRIGYSASKAELTTKTVKGSEKTVPNPQGSDLWLDEYSRTDSLSFTVNVPDDISVIVASDGTKPAPSQLSIRWPLDNRTPWSGPLIVGGVVLLLLGLGLYLWALAHLRRTRGPRRKSPKMPKPPRQRNYKPRKKGIEPPRGGRRSAARRMVAVVPVVLVGTLLMSGCSSELWPDFLGGASAASPTPTTTPTAVADSHLAAPAVTVTQLKAIVSRISAVATKADADKDSTLVKTRFEGAALDLRLANYGIRSVDNTYAALAPIPAGDVQLTLPEQTDTWPRTVFTVVQNPEDKTVPPVALMLVQATPRDNFKAEYAVALEASAVLPDVAPANVGSVQLAPDNKFFVLPPDQIAMAYGDLLEKGADSPSTKLFDTDKDTLLTLIGLDARKKLQAALPTTASMSFANSKGAGDEIAFHTNDNGGVVAVYLNETVTVKPVQAGAAVNPEGAVKSLSGITGTTKGTEAVYGDQLLFYVPPLNSKKKILLLGFATGLVSAKELP